MTPEQRRYWQNHLLPKLCNNVELAFYKVADRPMSEWRNEQDLHNPWLWIGSRNEQTINPRGKRMNGQAIIRSPGPPIYPNPRSSITGAHRVIWHLLVAPLPPEDQIRYQPLRRVYEHPNVNPLHHRHVPSRRVPNYEPPEIEIDELAELRELLAEGHDPAMLLQDGFTQEQLDAARNA